MKKSKQAYYDKYFERNWNNIKNTWKGIKSLISLKTKASSVPTVLSLENGDTITNNTVSLSCHEQLCLSGLHLEMLAEVSLEM